VDLDALSLLLSSFLCFCTTGGDQGPSLKILFCCPSGDWKLAASSMRGERRKRGLARKRELVQQADVAMSLCHRGQSERRCMADTIS
jgi:hypothetical protein